MMKWPLLLLLVVFSRKILCSQNEEKIEGNSHNLSREKTSLRFNSHSSSPAASSSFSSSFWDEEEEDDDGDTNILVFEDTSHRTESRELAFDEVFGDETQEQEEEDATKTKRNSLTDNKGDAITETAGHSSLPKAAALQSGVQGLSIGGLNPYNRGQLFQGFNYPRNPSCGMCSRERNLCQIISGIFTRYPLPYGYSLVTPIPAGVCNITIVETKPSKNFFALRKKDGSYVLNGNWKIQAAGNYGISGTLFSYSPSDGTRGEKLEAPGPLIEPIDLMIIYQSPNPGIKYEYRVPIHDLNGGQQPPARILPVIPNHGSIPNTFNLDNPLPTQNKFPSSVASNPSQTGGSTLLSGRTSFPTAGHGTGKNTVFPHRPSTALDTPKSIGSINNWNTQFRPGMNRVPLNPGTVPASGSQSPSFGQGVGLLYPPQTTSTGSQLFTGGVGTRTSSDSRFKTERFPGVLNTDPRTIPGRAAFPEEKKYGGHSHVPFQGSAGNNSLGIKRTGSMSPFSPRGTGVAGRGTTLATNDNRIHRTRHKHGSRDILPGPAVGGKGLSPITPGRDSSFPGVIQPRIPLKTNKDEEAKGKPEDRERKRRRRGRRKNGRKKNRKGRKKRFHWVFKGLTECTRTCGGGNQTSVYSCERRRKAKVVADKLCDDIPKEQQKVISCNLKPCPARWVPGDWSECSVTCGIGVQTRPLLCKQEVSPSLTMMVPEGACLSPKEGNTTQVCQMEECPTKEPKWKVGEWSACSSDCGVGVRARPVNCIVMGEVVDDEICSHIDFKPIAEESCDMGSCATNTWFFSKWSDKCSETCGEGIQKRVVMCMTMKEDDSSNSCQSTLRPDSTRSCTETSGCGGQWFAGPWSECSVSCGSGRETRIVKCLENRKNRWTIVDNLNCRSDLKPSLSRECILQPCKPEWYTSEWDECSVSCGNGFQKREVKCLDTSLKTSPNCFNISKPETVRACGGVTCSTIPSDHRDSKKEENKEKSVNITQAASEKSSKGGKNPFFFTPSFKHTNITSKEASFMTPGHSDERKDARGKHDGDVSQKKTTVSSSHGDVFSNFDDSVTKKESPRDNNQQKNELEVVHETGSALNVIPDKDAQGDESVSDDEDDKASRDLDKEEKEKTEKDKSQKKSETDQKEKEKTDSSKEGNTQYSCIDRIKNCLLVFRARLCRLKYYNKLCCLTCQGTTR